MRVPILDGFRVIAIFIVMLFHYFSRFFGQYYSYDMDTSTMFNFGAYGVHLFFIISGYVIFMSLESSDSFKTFLKKRYVRLAPGMLGASLITFIIFILFGTELMPKSANLSNLLFSNTFLPPELFQGKVQYIDGAYWSIWAEICFYILIAALFFISSQNVINSFAIISVLGMFLFYSPNTIESITGINMDFLRKFFSVFNFFGYSIWFLIGILLRKLHLTRRRKYLFGIIICFFLINIIHRSPLVFVLSCLIFTLLYLFIYSPQVINWIGSPLMAKLGVATYAIYLLHQNIGVLIINKISPYFGPYNIVTGVIIIPIIFWLGLLFYNYFEKPAGAFLKRYIIKPKAIKAKSSESEIF